MDDDSKETLFEKLKYLSLNFRILILLFFLLISFFAISWNFGDQGVVINGISPTSPASEAGMTFESQTSLRNLEKIESINGVQITNLSEFYSQVENLEENSTANIKTNKDEYRISVPKFTNLSPPQQQIGISVREEATSNIRKGIELEGGSRLILNPTSELTESEYELLVETLQNRLDIFGASGTTVSALEDSVSQDQFIVVESISSNKNDIYELISREGNFEAQIGNDTVFTGDNVVHVFNDPQNANLQGCSQSEGGQICTFAFSVQIDDQGAEQFFQKTSNLSIVGESLSEQVTFFLDGREITSLDIASSFKYDKVNQPQITVSGDVQPTRDEAVDSAQKEMKFLQTILSTQSLPSELEVEQSYSISPSRGEQLLENALLVGLFAILLVSAVVAFRFSNVLIFVGISVALLAELFIILGAAAFMKISIDLAAIGGLIAAIGTGVDDQIIITDEYFRKRKKSLTSKRRVKHAMTIIAIAYLTTVVAMAPFLFFASLSLVKGFAFMILVGVTAGVLVTRPAYAAYLRLMMTTKAQRDEEEEEESK